MNRFTETRRQFHTNSMQWQRTKWFEIVEFAMLIYPHMLLFFKDLSMYVSIIC